MSLVYDLIVIGGGAAGVTAADTGRTFGLKTLLLEEQVDLGGNIYRNIEYIAKAEPKLYAALGENYLAGKEIFGKYARSPDDTWCDTQVWHLDQSGMIGILRGGTAEFLQAKRVVVASGAMERPVPIPGWTLPGVLTAGACQTLLKSSALAPAFPTVLAGSGPLLLLLACQLLALGAPLKAVVLTTPLRQYLAGLRELFAVVQSPQSLLKGLSWLAQIRRGGVPIYSGAKSLSIRGDDRATGLEFWSGGHSHSLDGEIILLHEGLVPNTSLTMASDCDHEWDERQLCWRPKTNVWGQTSAGMIYVAGDCSRILGADAAPLSAALSVLAIACDLGRIPPLERNRMAQPLEKALRKLQRFRRFLDTIYRPPSAIGAHIADDTIVCRCEGVSAGAIRQVIKLKCVGPNQAKSFTRCGMGPCQGRMCGLAVTEIFAHELGKQQKDVGHYRIRPPIKPLTLEEFAGAVQFSEITPSKGMLMLALNAHASGITTSE